MNVWDSLGANSVRERILFVSLALPFVVLLPVLLLLHGYIWTSSGGTSSAVVVYLMKLAPLCYLLAGLLALGIRGIISAARSPAVAVMASVIVLGLVAPFLLGARPSMFYYAADAAGLAATFGYILVTYALLKQFPGLRGMIFWVMVVGAVVTSAVIVGLYVWSGGNKVSIPPDIHYGIALGLLTYLASLAEKFRFKLGPLAIMAGVGASQFRMNMLVAGISIAASWFWVVALKRGARFHLRLLETALLIAVMVLPFSSPIYDTLERFGLVMWNPMEAISAIIGGNAQILGEVNDKDLAGQAVDQRYVETLLVFQEVMRQPLAFITGQGFGATFENTASVISTGGEREHSVHNSLAALLLRNGLPGVMVFLIPAVFAIRTAFRPERALFISSIALLAIYLACMADQYVYWGGYLGIAIAVWLFTWRHQPEGDEAA